MTDDHHEGTDELDPPMVPFAIAGTAIWAVIGMALLPFSERLAASGHGSWLWTCLAGFLLGVAGLLAMIHHDGQRASRRP